MRALRVANLVLLIALGLTSGLAKILLLPQEVEFFGGAGLGETAIVLFGATQVIAGILLVFEKTRTLGAIVLAATFCTSTVLIFVNGKIAFGLFSILPILMLGVVLKGSIQSLRAQRHIDA